MDRSREEISIVTNTAAAAPVALVTGGGRRIGAAIVRHLHARGYRVAIHYASSAAAAAALADSLEADRADSTLRVQADLREPAQLPRLCHEVGEHWGRLDALVNNASTFFPTPVDTASPLAWEALFDVNAKAPFFLAQAAAPWLRRQGGSIVNITDVHGQRPMKGFPIYSAAKAALTLLTASLARELAPQIRVNAVAPGSILWSEPPPPAATQAQILQRIALRRQGEPSDIAEAVTYLLGAPYVTGQVLAVDGGRTVQQ